MESREIVSRMWKALREKGSHGYQSSFADCAAAIKEAVPGIDYLEYKKTMIQLMQDMARMQQWPVIPEAFDVFIKSFADALNPTNILVPFANGLECDAFKDQAAVEYVFYNSEYKNAAALFLDLNSLDQLPEQGSYDLIVSALPIEPLTRLSISCRVTEQCSKLLSDNGYCVFTYGKAITFGTSARWLSHLESKGLCCEAIIDMPKGAYAPATMVDAVIAVFSRHKADKRFVGLVTDKGSADKIVENFFEKKESANAPKYGIFVDSEIGSYSEYSRIYRVNQMTNSLAKAYNGKLLMLQEVGTVHAPNKNHEFPECDSAVYVPKLGNSPAVTSPVDFKIKAQNYFQVACDPEKVLPRFLAFFLNTEEGLRLRQMSYVGATIPSLNKTALGEMTFPCPTINLQSDYLQTYDRLEVLRVEIETLKNRLQKMPASYVSIRKDMKDINNTGDKFLQWIETLPYPIATILKRYSVAEANSKKQETLFYFFEAYAIFLATLLSAAMNKNIFAGSDLKGVDPDFFERASFGNWVRMDRALSNLFLTCVNDRDDEKKKIALECFKTSDEFLIKLLCNKNVCNLLDSASNYRNVWKGHSGITSEEIYRDHAATLGDMLSKLQESIKDVYERVRLIRPLSLSYSGGLFSNRVEVLTGSNPIFPKDTIEAVTPLDENKLYLQILDTGEMLELPPYFILKNSPADVKNACYFYSRVEKGNTKYVSYHYDGRPEDLENGVTAYNHIRQLLSD